MISISYQSSSSVVTSLFIPCRVSRTSFMSSIVFSSSNLELISVNGLPTSDSIRLNNSVASGVNRRRQSSVSRKRIAISVLSSRFFMSSFAWESWSIFSLSSWLTEVNSSFEDWASSRAVCSSSFVLRNSSLVACNSSLRDFSSSFEVSSSSIVARRDSFVDFSSFFKASSRRSAASGFPSEAPFSDALFSVVSRMELSSSKTTRYRFSSSGLLLTGSTIKSIKPSSPLYSTLIPSRVAGLFPLLASLMAPVSLYRSLPRAISRIFISGLPSGGARYFSVLP